MIFDPFPRVDGIDSAGDPITALGLGYLSGKRPTAPSGRDTMTF